MREKTQSYGETTKIRWEARIEAEYQAMNLTPHYRAVLIILLTFRGHGGRIFPSHESIAARVVQSGLVRTCCVRTVERGLNHARTLGLVWWLPQSRREGWRKLRSSNLYFLNVPSGPVKPGQRPVWPCRPTDRQAVRVKVEEEKKTPDKGPVPRVDLLAAARKMMEARLAARYVGGCQPTSPW